ncbi:hypothetical protein DDZ13_01925 [Coraliomargarita sinensis]|uniref:Uncharacterized protein n=1 Tax=Coraliomargarita sinensis TaxID=2174842 RepID=A0A317ZJ53_9BACT|nr:hypothetical protein [Coraliomargarita sinensis]PXA05655.1 hypothetical protein DDZ13_01925 [Coraliomargarita sinensis]
MNTSTEDWIAVVYPESVRSDYLTDQQTGQPEADIVGTVELNKQPGFYRQYLDVGNDGLIHNDELAFRVRLGGDTNSTGLDTTVLVGISFHQPGQTASIDLFVGVNPGPGNRTYLNFYDPGDDLNTSPDTTSVLDYSGPTGSSLTWQRDERDTDFGNYFSFLTVDSTTDHYLADENNTDASNDLGGTGGNDMFVSFRVEMMNIIEAASDLKGITVDENTAMSYVVLTSNQDNAFNQDLGGHDGSTGSFDKSSSTWGDLGGVTMPYLGDEGVVPEASNYALIVGSFVLVLSLVSRRR